MARFSLKLLVLILISLAFAAFLSWGTDYGNTYTNPQGPLRREVEAEKSKQREVEADEDTNELQTVVEAEQLQRNPKIALQIQDKHDSLQKTEESQEDSNQRTDTEGIEALQLSEISGDKNEQDQEDGKKDLQGNENGNSQEHTAEDHGGRIKTFFTDLPTSFTALELEDGSGIPTSAFLKAGIDLTPFLDKFGKTSLTLAHQDLSGNAKKIYAVYDTDPQTMWTLQKLVLHEIENGDFEVDGKGTISLLWLKRGFDFLAGFLHRLADGEEPGDAAQTAYDNTLAKHHNIFLRGTFMLAFKTLPYRKDVFKRLAVNPEDTSIPNFDDIVSEDMREYNKGLESMLQIISDFYTEHGLDIF